MATAVIGNSHAKVIWRAPNTITNPLDARAYYLVPKDWRAETIDADGGRQVRLLAFPAIDDDPGVSLGEYDNIVLSACGCWAPRNELLETEEAYHPLRRMACPGRARPGAPLPPGVRLVSASVFDITVEAWIRDLPMTRLVQYLAGNTDSRIFMLPAPPPNRGLKDDPDWVFNKWYGENGPRVWRDYFNSQILALKKVATELSPKVTFIDYPVADVLEDGFMDASLCNPDPFHANSTYGAMLVDAIAAHIRAG